MNKCIFIGRLGQRPELRKTTNGKSVATISLAIKGGENTTWLRLNAWGQTAEFVSEFCDKGTLVVVEARARSYTQEVGGKKVTQIDFNIDWLGKLADKKKEDIQEPVFNKREEIQEPTLTGRRDFVESDFRSNKASDSLDIDTDALPFY